MAQFFSSFGMDEHPGHYFFSLYHLVYLALTILIFYLLFKFLKKKNRKTQDKYISAFLILILVMKYAGEAIFIYEYYFIDEVYSSFQHPLLSFNTIISFELCGILNILLPIVIWFDIKPLKDFVFASSILGGIALVLYPVNVLYGDPFVLAFPMFRTAIVHFFLIFIPLFLIHRGDYRLKKERWLSVAIGLLVCALWALIGGLFINPGTNHMFIFKNPFYGGPIPIISAIPNGWHDLLLAVLVTIGYILVYQIAKLFQNKKVSQNGLTTTEISS